MLAFPSVKACRAFVKYPLASPNAATLLLGSFNKTPRNREIDSAIKPSSSSILANEQSSKEFREPGRANEAAAEYARWAAEYLHILRKQPARADQVDVNSEEEVEEEEVVVANGP